MDNGGGSPSAVRVHGLRSYLKDPSTPRVWTSEKVQIAIDIAEALSYAHSLWPPVCHGDLKSRHVLLSKDMEAKLSGFGVLLDQPEGSNSRATRIPGDIESPRWVAPEVVAGKRLDSSTAADIFSFGAILCELDTHALPYDDVISGDNLAEAALRKPTPSASCPEKSVKLANECFAYNLAYRPS